MKKIVKITAVLTLVLAMLLGQMALAEPSEAIQGVYDALVAEDSGYSEIKAIYMEYFPEVKFEEILQDDGFTIAAAGSEYMEGSWTFVQDGDYLTATLANDDFNGLGMTLYVIDAVGAYLGMNTDLLSSYVNGLGALGVENDDFRMAEDEENGTTTVSINMAAPWEMKELDEMVLSADTMFFGALDGNSSSMASSIGKMMMIANGSADDVKILVGEYGGLDDLAYQSIINAINVLQPEGWEDFVANYTALEDVEADGYSVRLNVGMDAVAEFIEDGSESYSYAVLHFGA